MEEQLNPKAELSGLTVKDMFFKYARFIPLFILSVAIALLVAWVYLRYATPIYTAQGSILIKNESNRPGGGGGDDKFEDLFMNSGTSNIQNEMEVLKSRPLMERVVKALDLDVNYFAVGKIRSPNIYKNRPFNLQILEIADSTKGFSLNIKFKSDNTFQVNANDQTFLFGETFRNNHGVFKLSRATGSPGDEYTVSWEPVHVKANELAREISVVPKTQGTGILLINIQTTNPELSADIINQLMIEYQAANIEDKQTTMIQTLDFIDDRMAKLQSELDSIERLVLDYRQRHNILFEDQQTTDYLTQLTETDQQIYDLRMQGNVINEVDQYLKDSRNNYQRVPSALTLSDPTLNGLIAAYNAAQLDRKALLDGNAPEGNIVVQQKQQEIEKLRQSIIENLANLENSNNALIGSLRSRSSSVESQVRLLPARIRDLVEIERQKESKLALYTFFLQKREETAISQASTISNSSVVDRAYPNKTPVEPNPRNIRLMALLIGLALPALIIFAMELLNDKVNTRYDIERLTDAPILGEIGHAYSESALVVTKTSRSMVAEQFRSIRSNLQYVLGRAEKPVILVTSSFSGEGKSFVSTNMGAVMALTGKKTVVLEFDIRKPKVLSGLGLAKRPGITNFIVGNAELAELPIQVPGYPDLYVISCGPVPPNPAELLLDPKITDLFSWLKNQFDVIIIDTAPIGMVSDAMTLAQFADNSLYIVRQEYTFKKQIGLIDEIYHEKKLPKLSLILNDVKMKAGYGYYGYGRYGYGKGYGEGYYIDDNHQPRSWWQRFTSRKKAKIVD